MSNASRTGRTLGTQRCHRTHPAVCCAEATPNRRATNTTVAILLFIFMTRDSERHGVEEEGQGLFGVHLVCVGLLMDALQRLYRY